MDIKSWASSLASRSQQLARDSLAYVNRHIDMTYSAERDGEIERENVGTPGDVTEEEDDGHTVNVFYVINKPLGLTLDAELDSVSGGSPRNAYLWSHLISDPPRIPGGKCADCPCTNVYRIDVGDRGRNSITLQCVRNTFPIAGKFIFRFKLEGHGTNSAADNYCWLDISEPHTTVPFYKGALHVKATQIPSHLNSFYSVERPTSVKSLHTRKPKTSNNAERRAERNTEQKQPLKSKSTIPLEPNDDLITRLSDQSPTSDGLSSASSKELSHQSNSEVTFDLLEPDDDADLTKSASGIPLLRTELCREELAAQRESRKAQRVASKLQESQKTRILEENKQQEKLAVSDSVREQLERWARQPGGNFKDIRTLLISIQDVLWADSGWTNVSLSTLMGNPASVKTHFRKAMLLCHPDKHQKAPAEQVFRAETIFQAINEAFKVSSL